MGKQSELIDCLKGRLRLSSDYALAQRWQTEPTRISQYRRDRLHLPIEYIIDIADQTGGDALTIVRTLEYERASRRGQDVSKRLTWMPNENIKHHAPAWVARQHYHKGHK